MSTMSVPPEGQPRADGIPPARPPSAPGAGPVVGPVVGPTGRSSIDPRKLAYLMGPAALGALLLLMRFGEVAKESAWVWVAIFIAIPLTSVIADHLYDTRPTPARLHLRVAVQAAAVTTVIYLSGWGPVLCGAYAFLALENVARCGSRVWRVTALWSLLGIAIGQVGIWQHVFPSFLSLAQTNALALMGAFVLFFVIRMAGATMEQKELAEATTRLSEDRFRSLIQNSSDVTLVMDEEGNCTYVSPAITALLGLRPAELVGTRPTDLVHPDDQDRVRSRLGSELADSPENVLIQFRMARTDGTWCELEAVVSNQLRPALGGRVRGQHPGHHRAQGVRGPAGPPGPPRPAHRRCPTASSSSTGPSRCWPGHGAPATRWRRSSSTSTTSRTPTTPWATRPATTCCRPWPSRFVAMLRADDTVGRLGGDEFVVLAEGLSLEFGPEPIAERIREALRQPFVLHGYEDLPLMVTASVGIATGLRASAHELLRDADVALYQAKARGRNCSVRFESAMQTAAVDRLALKSDLDAASASGQFFLLYQPIVDLQDGGIRTAEALIRWQHPTQGVISPRDFIPVLEESGMIVDVGRWVLRQACAQAARWHAQGQPVGISVNLSMRQLESTALVGPRHRGPGRRRPGPRPADPRGHRVVPHAGRRGHGGPAAAAEGPGGHDRHRRLRDGLLLLGLPAAVPGRRAQDRRVVRRRAGRIPGPRRPGPHPGGAGPDPGSGHPGRGDRGRRSSCRTSGPSSATAVRASWSRRRCRRASSAHCCAATRPRGPPGRRRRPSVADRFGTHGPGLLAAFFLRWLSRMTSRSTSAPSTAAIRSTQMRLRRVLKKTNPTVTVLAVVEHEGDEQDQGDHRHADSDDLPRVPLPARGPTGRALTGNSWGIGHAGLLRVDGRGTPPDRQYPGRPPGVRTDGAAGRAGRGRAAGRPDQVKSSVAWWAKLRMGSGMIPNTTVKPTHRPMATHGEHRHRHRAPLG